jgi:hypothetical protein
MTEQVSSPVQADPQRAFLEDVLARTRAALAAATDQNIELTSAMTINARVLQEFQDENERLRAKLAEHEGPVVAGNRSRDTGADV